MVEWIDYSQNIPLSKVRQEHSAIKDSGELLNAVLAVGVAGHFPPDSCNAMLLPLHQLTLALNFIILEFSFSFNLRPHQCPHPLTVCHRDILSMVEWIDYIQNIPLSKVQQEHSAIKDSGELSHAVLAVGVAGHFPPDSYNAMLLLLYKLTLPLTFIILEFSFSCNLRPHQCPHLPVRRSSGSGSGNLTLAQCRKKNPFSTKEEVIAFQKWIISKYGNILGKLLGILMRIHYSLINK
jgi:hypothetical protein